MFSLWRCFLVCTIVSTKSIENVQGNLSLHTVERRRWCDPAQPALSIGTATLNALLASGPCRPWAVGTEALGQNTHPVEVKWQNPSLFTCFSTAFLGARGQGFQRGQVTLRVYLCRVSLRSLCCCHTRPCSVPCVSQCHCQDGHGPKNAAPAPLGCEGCLHCPTVLCCKTSAPPKSLGRWPSQLLLRTVTVPDSHHFRPQNKALTPLL